MNQKQELLWSLWVASMLPGPSLVLQVVHVDAGVHDVHAAVDA